MPFSIEKIGLVKFDLVEGDSMSHYYNKKEKLIEHISKVDKKLNNEQVNKIYNIVCKEVYNNLSGCKYY